MIASAMRRLLNRPPRRSPPRAPDGMTIYAVGDIHGRADLLARLLHRIEDDQDWESGRAVIVMLGDYVDRGPASREVIDLLLAAKNRRRTSWRFLRGNHDQALLDFLNYPSTGPSWSRLGGDVTLRSYGIEPPDPNGPAAPWNLASVALSRALPPTHFRFFKSLESYCELGDYLFVHAGIRPGVPVDAQKDRDLLWIRESFLNDMRPLPKVVVHGHTPSIGVHIDDRRIGVDTGAYVSGILSAVRLRSQETLIIEARIS